MSNILYEGKQIDIRQTSKKRMSIDIYKDLNEESIETISGLSIDNYEGKIKKLGKEIDNSVIKSISEGKNKSTIIKNARKIKEDFDDMFGDLDSDIFKDDFYGGTGNGEIIVKDDIINLMNLVFKSVKNNQSYPYLDKDEVEDNSKIEKLVKENYSISLDDEGNEEYQLDFYIKGDGHTNDLNPEGRGKAMINYAFETSKKYGFDNLFCKCCLLDSMECEKECYKCGGRLEKLENQFIGSDSEGEIYNDILKCASCSYQREL